MLRIVLGIYDGKKKVFYQDLGFVFSKTVDQVLFMGLFIFKNEYGFGYAFG